MILTCPSCATSYFTPDDAIGAEGRRVRCQSCAHTWHARIEEPLELTQAPAEPVTAAAAEPASRPEFGRREDAPETLAETPAPELPKAYRARAEQQRRVRRAATHGAVWAGLASVFVGLIAAAWLFRVEVVELYPRAAAAYAMVGSPVNPVGLQFEAVGAKASPTHPDKVMVSGALRNVRDREVVSPAVRLALLDAHGVEIAHKIVAIDAAPVLPGGVQGFAALLDDPGARAAGVGVDFVTPSIAPKAVDAGHAPAAGAHGDEAHPGPTSAPTVRRPPAAPEGGMRPAITRELASPNAGPPVEAHPAVDTLDKPHGEAVSASHHG